MDYPKISIVTPSFNQGKYLEQTILSVINQNYPNLEYIIIDGGSSDNSAEIIKKYEKHLTYWVSEKDNGQSNAINKGLKKITGDIFNWLNSDDYLENGALLKIAEAYQKNPGKKVFCFGLSNLNNEEKVPFIVCNNPNDELQCYCAPAINQQSTFYSRESVTFLSTLNPLLHYAMDYEWWIKFLFRFDVASLYVSKDVISVYRMHEESKSMLSHEYFLDDIASVLNALCIQMDMNNFSDFLKSRFRIISSYDFSMTVPKEKKEIIERMVIYFLLKWSRAIYKKDHFLFAKEIVREIKFNKYNLTEAEENWLRQLRTNSSSGNWFIYRVRKKIFSK